MDGAAQSGSFQEVEFVEVEGPGAAEGTAGEVARARGANFIGEAHLDEMAGFAAFHQAQDAVRDEATHSPAGGIVAETRTASEPEHGELQTSLSFEAAVTEEMRVDGAVGSRELETRNEEVLELFPHV